MKIGRITFAVNNMPAMVEFYNQVLDANLTQMGDSPFHSGQIAGLNVLMCPNAIAEVDANQNRQQFHFVVDDLDAALAKVDGTKGTVDEKQGNECGVRDPDGNTLVFAQS